MVNSEEIKQQTRGNNQKCKQKKTSVFARATRLKTQQKCSFFPLHIHIIRLSEWGNHFKCHFIIFHFPFSALHIVYIFHSSVNQAVGNCQAFWAIWRTMQVKILNTMLGAYIKWGETKIQATADFPYYIAMAMRWTWIALKTKHTRNPETASWCHCWVCLVYYDVDRYCCVVFIKILYCGERKSWADKCMQSIPPGSFRKDVI